MKRQFTTGVSSKTSPHFIISQYTEFMEENFKVSSKSVDSGRYTRDLWKSQTNANHGLSWSWPFHITANHGLSWSWPFHITLNRKVKPVNRRYVEQAFSNQ